MFESLDFNTCMLLAAGGTLYFCSKPENERQEIVGNVLWYFTNKYHQVRIMMNELFENTKDCYGINYDESSSNDEEEESGENRVEIISYNKSEENGLYIAELDEIELSKLYNFKVENQLTFLKYIENNKYYLKRLSVNTTDGYEARYRYQFIYYQ